MTMECIALIIVPLRPGSFIFHDVFLPGLIKILSIIDEGKPFVLHLNKIVDMVLGAGYGIKV